jgi:hypothetical protein
MPGEREPQMGANMKTQMGADRGPGRPICALTRTALPDGIGVLVQYEALEFGTTHFAFICGPLAYIRG